MARPPRIGRTRLLLQQKTDVAVDRAAARMLAPVGLRASKRDSAPAGTRFAWFPWFYPVRSKLRLVQHGNVPSVKPAGRPRSRPWSTNGVNSYAELHQINNLHQARPNQIDYECAQC